MPKRLKSRVVVANTLCARCGHSAAGGAARQMCGSCVWCGGIGLRLRFVPHRLLNSTIRVQLHLPMPLQGEIFSQSPREDLLLQLLQPDFYNSSQLFDTVSLFTPSQTLQDASQRNALRIFAGYPIKCPSPAQSCSSSRAAP